MYLDALAAAGFSDGLSAPGGTVRDVARAVAAAPAPPRQPSRSDRLLDGLAAAYSSGYAHGVPALRQVLSSLDTGMPADEELRLLWTATTTAMRLWDAEHWDTLSARRLLLARRVGALGELPLALTSRAYFLLFQGDLPGAALLADQADAITRSTGASLAPYGALAVAALRGDVTAFASALDTARTGGAWRGEGRAMTVSGWANALLLNAVGNYDDALAAATTAYDNDSGLPTWPAAELIEAAARTGILSRARQVHDRITEIIDLVRTPFALGIHSRTHALLVEGPEAERSYRAALDHLRGTGMRIDYARSHLVFGEWLRRERRRAEALCRGNRTSAPESLR